MKSLDIFSYSIVQSRYSSDPNNRGGPTGRGMGLS